MDELRHIVPNPEYENLSIQISSERKRLMEALTNNESLSFLSEQLAKILELVEKQKQTKPFTSNPL